MKKLFLVLLPLVIGLAATAQNERTQMENERKALQRELKEMQAQYNKLRGAEKVNLGQLHALEQKMQLQGRYINNINKELRLLSDDIYTSTLEVNRLQRQLDTLKSQYARSVVYAYKNRGSYDYLNFIFSAGNFNDALKRIAYLRSYRAYRQQQVANIIETQAVIQERKKDLLAKSDQKKKALQNQTQQLNVLADQRKEKDAVVAKLKSQEKEISKQIAAKKKRDNILKGQIAAIIRREIDAAKKAEAARRAAEKKDAAANPTTTTATPAKKEKTYKPLNSSEADIALNNKFELNRGKLPWPVDNGSIVIPFGRSKVGGLDFDSPGISIGTPGPGTPVKSIFDGTVSAVSNTGDGMMIMVRHGQYFSVYSNLSSASVSKNDVIRVGQTIGRAAGADDGSGGQVDLIIMKEYQQVNPTPWLRR